MGGDHRSEAVEACADVLLSLRESQPYMTPCEYQAALAEQGNAVSVSAIWRFFDRRGMIWD
jgi:hypothetical protein